MVLLVGAGLLVRTVRSLSAVQPGFDPSGIVAFETNLAFTTYPDADRWTGFFEALTQRVRAIPGVASAAVVSALPFTNQRESSSVIFQGRGRPEHGFPEAIIRSVTPEYFATLRIPVRRGRALTPNDRLGAPRVVVINETFARTQYPNEDPIGKRILFQTRDTSDWREIVGVAGDVRNEGLTREPRIEIYVPFAQQARPAANVVVRAACGRETSCDPVRLTSELRRVVREVDPAQPISGLATMQARIDRTIARERFGSMLLGAFSTLAVLLAAVGIYGVVSYSVAQQRHEIGIRRALGARERDVMALVLGKGLRVAIAGIVVGILLAAATTRALERMLFGVKPTDALTFSVVAIGLALVALIATYVPARRALGVDVGEVLRT
jgi:putative ABC transport system permease protein